MDISTEFVYFSQESLSTKRLSAKWVPLLLIIDQKRSHVTTSEHIQTSLSTCRLNLASVRYMAGAH